MLMSSAPINSENNELAQLLIDLRSEVTQDQLRLDTANQTQTKPINVGTIRNCEGDLRPTKLTTLRRCWYYGLRPRMPEQTWIKVLIHWALKKDQEALDSLHEERVARAKNTNQEAPKRLPGKAYTYAEAIGLLGLAEKDGETEQDLKALKNAARSLKPTGRKLLTEILLANPEFLHQQLKVLAPLVR
jgi:hypothetical protein